MPSLSAPRGHFYSFYGEMIKMFAKQGLSETLQASRQPLSKKGTGGKHSLSRAVRLSLSMVLGNQFRT